MRNLNDFVLSKTWAKEGDQVVDVGSIVGKSFINKGFGNKTNIHYNAHAHQTIAMYINNAIKGIPNFDKAASTYLDLSSKPVTQLGSEDLDKLKKAIPGTDGLIGHIIKNFDCVRYFTFSYRIS